MFLPLLIQLMRGLHFLCCGSFAALMMGGCAVASSLLGHDVYIMIVSKIEHNVIKMIGDRIW